MREPIKPGKLSHNGTDLSALADEAFSKLLSKIASLNNVISPRTVSLKRCCIHKLSKERQEKLALALYKGRVNEINLADNQLCDMANIIDFFDDLCANLDLDKIDLNNNALASHQDAKSFFTSSLFAGHFSEVSLKNNHLKTLDFETFKRFLLGFSALGFIKKLNLANNALTFDQVMAVSKFISAYPAPPLEIILHPPSKYVENVLFSVPSSTTLSTDPPAESASFSPTFQ